MFLGNYRGPSWLEEKLVESGAVKFGEFTLTSGKKSDYYVDVKLASTKPDILAQIGSGISEILRSEFPQASLISGMELGAVNIAAAASLGSGLPYLIIRKKPQSHGTASQIEGDYTEGSKVVIVEDVTTTGGSVIKSMNILKEAGLHVIGAITVVDRQEGADQLMAENGLPFFALTTASSLKRLK